MLPTHRSEFKNRLHIKNCIALLVSAIFDTVSKLLVSNQPRKFIVNAFFFLKSSENYKRKVISGVFVILQKQTECFTKVGLK